MGIHLRHERGLHLCDAPFKSRAEQQETHHVGQINAKCECGECGRRGVRAKSAQCSRAVLGWELAGRGDMKSTLTANKSSASFRQC